MAAKTSRSKTAAEPKPEKAKKAPRKSKVSAHGPPAGEAPAPEPTPANPELERLLAELAQARQESENRAREAEELRQDRDSLSQEAETLHQEGDRLRQEAESLRQERDTLRQEVESLRQEAESRRQQAEGLQITLEAQTAALAESRARSAVLEAAQGRFEEQLTAQGAELELARSRVEALEGELEELDLLREDLEESIIDRRREVKALRQSEKEARQFAQECGAFREEADTRVRLAESVAETLRSAQQQTSEELSSLRERLQAEEKLRQEATTNLEVHQGAFQAARRRLLDAERRATEATTQLQALQGELEALKQQTPAPDPALQRRCELLQLELNTAVREQADLERAKTQLEFQKRQLQEELTRAKQAPPPPVVPPGPVVSQPTELELELRQHKLRADELREQLRKQRQENDRLQERLEHVIKAKDHEEQQRREVEYKLRVALRNQARG